MASYTHVLLCRNESNKTLSCPSVHQSLVSAIEHMRKLCDAAVTTLNEKDPTLTYAIRISASGTERFIDQVSTSTTNNLILSNTTTTIIQPIYCYFILPIAPSAAPSTTAQSTTAPSTTMTMTTITAQPKVVTGIRTAAYDAVLNQLREHQSLQQIIHT